MKRALISFSFLLGISSVVGGGGTARANVERPPLLRDVGIDQRLGEQVPLDLEFGDETGRKGPLRRYLGGRPVLLVLAYYRCPMLCGEVLAGLARSLNGVAFVAGREFDVLTVSFDPTDGPEEAAAKRDEVVGRYRKVEGRGAWHFLTGDAPAIEGLTRAVGFRAVRDPKRDEFAHGAAVFVLTPEGRVSRVLYGVEFAPRDLKLALVEASNHRIGGIVEQILLFCFHYDPSTGRYTTVALGAVRLGGILTVGGIGAFMIVLLRRERRRGAA